MFEKPQHLTADFRRIAEQRDRPVWSLGAIWRAGGFALTVLLFLLFAQGFVITRALWHSGLGSNYA